MRKKISLLLCGIMIVLALGGCASGSGADGQPADTADMKGSEDSFGPVEISIWHDGDEAIMNALQTRINDTLSSEKITVTFVKKPGLADQIKLYGNDEANGPDMYFSAHDSLGIYAEMGILSPVTDFISEDAMQDMLAMTVNGCTYKDTRYLLPVYFETLLFLYNKDLWKGDVPDTTDGLYEYMKANTDINAGFYGMVNQHSTAYNVAPFINGFGGCIIDTEGNPGLDKQETKDAILYNKKFAELQADGDYNTVTTLFNEGKAAAIIGGPWLMPGIKAAGIHLGFKSLLSFRLPNGNSLMPYAGIQGAGVFKHAARDKKDAIAKVLTVMASPETGVELAENFNCAPANEKAYEDPEVAANEMVAAMKETAQNAVPAPNIPQISVMWSPAESLLAAVNKSDEDVNKAAGRYQKEALAAVADMQ